jgi:GAF domain-containing protein
MYDPLIVDLFCEVYPEIAEVAAAVGQQARTLAIPHTVGEVAIHRSVDDTLGVPARPQLVAPYLGEAFKEVAESVLRLTPATGSAYFEYKTATNELACVHVSHPALEPILGLTMRPGERVSGWAAANLKSITNSDPALDLGDKIWSLRPPPRSMISAPVLDRKHAELKGVLSGYACEPAAFSREHTNALEAIAASLADSLTDVRVSRVPVLAFPGSTHSKAS